MVTVDTEVTFEWIRKSEDAWAIAIRNGVLGAIGVALMLIGDLLLGQSRFWQSLLEHTGMGIVVAAIAVFSYEHRAQLKSIKALLDEVSSHTTGQMERMTAATKNQIEGMTTATNAQLESMTAATNAMTAATNDQMRSMTHVTSEQVGRLISETETQVDQLTTMIQGEAVAAIPIALRKAFENTDPAHKLFDYTRDLLEAVMRMGKRKSWLDDVSLRFISELLLSVSTNASGLASSAVSGGYAFTLELPKSAAFLADKILAEEMKTMRAGDSYTVVSDFGSWRGELDTFYRESLKAAEDERVIIRRVFCRFGYDAKLSEADAEEILERHWNAAVNSRMTNDGMRRYQVGVLPRSVATKLGIHPKHRGVFRHAGQAVSFEPDDDSLARMQMSLAEIDRVVDDIDKLWKHAIRSFDSGEGTSAAGKALSFADARRQLGANWW